MEKREVGSKSSRTVPVIIENHENATKKTKLMVPSNYTAGQLVNILRSRMHLRPYHPVYLFLKSKQSPVLMSKSIGHLHYKHRDEKGLLRLIHAGQASFGFRGNIRAIRFRQKWIENLHNTLHQDAGAPQSYSGVPPPYFPLEPPATANFGAPLDVDGLTDSIEEIPINEDFYHDNMENTYTEIEDSFLISDMPSWQSSNMTGSSQSSALTNSSHSSALTDPWLSSSLADPWLSSATTNSGETSGMANSFLFSNHGNIDQALYLEMNLAMHLQNSIVSGSSSALATPNISANVQPPNVPNPQVPPNNLSFYDSDSDFYDSDKDVDMDE
ncbi:hypothetical protein AVEN_14642-1 [Araneus ventricosus]|uniref:Uncharacterized protein n=1 Tax=Araneus ventricosus TaxID=182803 RepID=A0A4Y2KWT2_ARAVE|nr:hypothetical protein AVEN_14642-1 [Araneus ventricosus]